MASNKKYRMGYKLYPREKKFGKSGGLMNAILKPNNNDVCPCGSTVDKLFTDEDGKEVTIPVRIKYKKCCRNKKIFVINEKAK